MNRRAVIPVFCGSVPPRVARRRRAQCGFTLTEAVLLIVVALVVTAVLFPFFNRSSHHHRQASGASNQKQIGIALLSYKMDYDDYFPPAAGSAVVNGRTVQTNWAVDVVLPGGGIAPGVLQPYCKNNALFHDPSGPSGATLTYMYNDLLPTAKASEIASPAQTVMTTYGADVLGNVGHAYERNGVPPNAVVNKRGRVDVGKGTFVTEESMTHFSGGSNFAFVDGHVKWYKPGAVFYPPLISASRVHRDAQTGVALGPDPAGGMNWNGIKWAGTFHLR